MLVGILHEDLGEDLGSWTHGNSTLTKKLVWSMLIISMLTFTHSNMIVWCIAQNLPFFMLDLFKETCVSPHPTYRGGCGIRTKGHFGWGPRSKNMRTNLKHIEPLSRSGPLLWTLP